MRYDLLHAQASVDWAKSQLPSFRKRLTTWLSENVYIATRQLENNPTDDILVAVEKEFLPLSFQVEVGAYINAIRSSLDILACVLADRHCKALIDEAYFPVAKSPAIFEAAIKTGKGLKGAKFVKALPTKERGIIESLKPYEGGNGLLYPLHLLDIVRKHQRLLTVDIRPAMLKVSWWVQGQRSPFKPVGAWVRGANDETVLGFVAKGAKQPKIEFTPQISFNETSYIPEREVVTTLYEFANLANAIITDFDY